MTARPNFQTEFLNNRLRGEPPPQDLLVLLEHRNELARRTGVELPSSVDWAPWLDTSYLSETDRADPDIRANVQAIAEVCALIDFVAEDEESNYLGYWRGPSKIDLAQAPIVRLDNEGQFSFCHTVHLAGALLVGSSQFDDLRAWLESIGVGSLPNDWDDLVAVDTAPSPSDLHETLYRKYSAAEAPSARAAEG